MNELVLTGCRPEPLLAYLKALGIWRLVSEQKDGQALGAWREGNFVLRTMLDEKALLSFFENEYQPTPIVAPWAGGSGFFQKDNTQAVEALARSKGLRLADYRQVIQQVRTILKEEKQTQKPTDEVKSRLLRLYRRALPDKCVEWMDSAVILQNTDQIFPPLLGTGGNDGRLDFTQNFMQHLCHLGLTETQMSSSSMNWLKNALFGQSTNDLMSKAIGQFNPGQAGGPNATQGMEGDALINPWDYVLMLEGALLLAGSVARRMGAHLRDKAAFPFTVRMRTVGQGSLAESEAASARGEIWLPLWKHAASLRELKLVFAEGRAQLGTHPCRDTVDFARAVAGLGVDRGLTAFVRYGLLKRSGKAYLATPLGQVEVKQRAGADLLFEIDDWLDSFRRACGEKTAPARFGAALRRLDSAIFDYCRYGGARFGAILCALGACERELARVGDKPGKIGDSKFVVKPAPLLSPQWLKAADDHSAEYHLALALASIDDKAIGPLRANLEPVDVRGKWPQWANKGGAVVWSAADVCRNLAAVLERRMIDASKTGAEGVPLTARRSASWDDIAALLSDQIDERRLEEWLWGAILLNWREVKDAPNSSRTESEAPLPRAYALLKLLFLPEWQALKTEHGDGVRPEPSILPLLRAGQLNRACEVALRRLRASGYMALPGPVSGQRRRVDFVTEEVDTMRLAAALLIPIPNTYTLQEIVLRPRPNSTSL